MKLQGWSRHVEIIRHIHNVLLVRCVYFISQLFISIQCCIKRGESHQTTNKSPHALWRSISVGSTWRQHPYPSYEGQEQDQAQEEMVSGQSSSVIGSQLLP